MSNLRKISFYLKPDQLPADKVASDIFDSLPTKERGRAMRAALLAGISLMKQEQRIPFLLAELLDAHTSMSDIQLMIQSVMPDALHNKSEIMAEMLNIIKKTKVITETKSSENNHSNAEETRKNANTMFPD